MKCWNCLKNQPSKTHVCGDCGQTLKPNPMQKGAATRRVDYLLKEAQEWDFLSEEVRSELLQVYRIRRERVQNITKKAAAQWPESDWTAAIWTQPEIPQPEVLSPRLDPKTVSQKLQRISEAVESSTPKVKAELGSPDQQAAPDDQKELDEAQPRATPEEAAPEPEAPPLFTPKTTAEVEAEPGSSQPLPEPVLQQVDRGMAPVNTYANKLMAEADIRWFHSLGALLVIAAVVGWLRASWDSYGRGLTGLLIVTSPAALHALAYSIRKSVPLSSRLLGILAGLLTAPALLAMHLFGFLPESVGFANYWTFSLVVSSFFLGLQAQITREKVPLYIGALCAVLAGWSQGALWTSGISLAVGFILSRISPANLDSEEERAWKGHLTRVTMAAGCFGSFATLALFKDNASPYLPLLMFTGALLFLHLPTLTRETSSNSSSRVLLQACLTVLGIFLMRFALDVPSSAAGLYALFATGLFLSARPDDEAGLLALRCGSALGFLGVLMGFIPSLGSEAGQGLNYNLMRLVLGCVGACFFAVMSRKKHLVTQRDTLGLLALLAFTRGWFRLFLSLCEGERGYFTHPDQLALLLGSFPVLVALFLLVARLLEPREQDVVKGYSSILLGTSFCFAVISSLRAELQSPVWAAVLGLLALVALLWERQILPARSFVPESPWAQVSQSLPVLLTRVAVWSAAVAFLCLPQLALKWSFLTTEVALFVCLMTAGKGYRNPAFELGWVLSFPTAVLLWQLHGPHTQFLVPLLLLALSWGTERLRSVSFGGAAAATGFIMLASAMHAPPALLLAQPLLFALAYVSPVPGRGPWKPLGKANYGFDILLNGAVLLSLFSASVEGGSALSLALTILFPISAAALVWLTKSSLGARVISSATPVVLLGSGLFWTLGQGAHESGLLLLVGAGALLFTKAAGPTRFDAANGLAIVGLTWLFSAHHMPPNTTALVFCLLVSEIGSLLLKKFQPNNSNALLLFGALVLTLGDGDAALRAVGLLAGSVAAVRGLVQAHFLLLGSGALMLLRFADATLVQSTSDLKFRLLPTVFALVGTSLYLWLREEHPARKMLGASPAALLRVALALNVIPALLAFTFGQLLGENFAWVLVSGVIYLLGSALTSKQQDLSKLLRQAGGYTLTGWAVVTLSRAALMLPWQLATLVVGLILVGVGVYSEKKRRGKSLK